MNPVFCSSPMWPTPGRRRHTPIVRDLYKQEIGSPRSAPWLCRPRASAWRSISGCAAVLSWGWMSEPSCVTCFGICGVYWSCCRIEEPFITSCTQIIAHPRLHVERLGFRARRTRQNMCWAQPSNPASTACERGSLTACSELGTPHQEVRRLWSCIYAHFTMDTVMISIIYANLIISKSFPCSSM